VSDLTLRPDRGRRLSILHLVADILRDEGYAVELARNGREALDVIARREEPALIVLDMRMGVIDGWEFARMLRAQQLGPPILVMTAARSARQWAEDIDAVGYLASPSTSTTSSTRSLASRLPPDAAASDSRSHFALRYSVALLTAVRRAITVRGAAATARLI